MTKAHPFLPAPGFSPASFPSGLQHLSLVKPLAALKFIAVFMFACAPLQDLLFVITDM